MAWPSPPSSICKSWENPKSRRSTSAGVSITPRLCLSRSNCVSTCSPGGCLANWRIGTPSTSSSQIFGCWLSVWHLRFPHDLLSRIRPSDPHGRGCGVFSTNVSLFQFLWACWVLPSAFTFVLCSFATVCVSCGVDFCVKLVGSGGLLYI